MIFAFFFPVVLARMKFLICPAENISATVFGMDCKPPHVFVPVPYALPCAEMPSSSLRDRRRLRAPLRHAARAATACSLRALGCAGGRSPAWWASSA